MQPVLASASSNRSPAARGRPASAGALVADRDALRAAVVERLKDAVEMPEQIQLAHEIARIKL